MDGFDFEEFYQLPFHQSQADYLFDRILFLYEHDMYRSAAQIFEQIDFYRLSSSMCRAVCLMAWLGRTSLDPDCVDWVKIRAYNRVAELRGKDVADKVLKESFFRAD